MILVLLPVFLWMLGAAVAMFIAVPLYCVWNSLAPTYFTFLPLAWQYIPFWDCVRMLLLAFILSSLFNPISFHRKEVSK